MIVKITINIVATILWLCWLVRSNRYTSGPSWRILLFFAAGGFSHLAFPLLYLNNPYTWVSLGSLATNIQHYIAVVGPSEEITKFAAFYFVSRLTCSIREPLDPFLQGASVGLGFAAIENLEYAESISDAGMFFRAVFCSALHAALAALAAALYGAAIYWLDRHRDRAAWGLAALGIILASLLHGCYDLDVLSSASPHLFSPILTMIMPSMLFLAPGRLYHLSPRFPYRLDQWAMALEAIGRGIDYAPLDWRLYARRAVYELHGACFFEAWADLDMAHYLAFDPYRNEAINRIILASAVSNTSSTLANKPSQSANGPSPFVLEQILRAVDDSRIGREIVETIFLAALNIDGFRKIRAPKEPRASRTLAQAHKAASAIGLS